MEPLQDTYTVRTRDGREYAGLVLSSLRIAAAQKIFSLEDSVRSDRMAGTWMPLARVLSLPEPVRPAPSLEPRASTGIALDLGSRPPFTAPPAPAPSMPYRPPAVSVSTPMSPSEAEGPERHRLRIAGGFLLAFGLLGMLGYALGKPNPISAVVMLVNTGLGIALLMNLEAVRRWALGWVVAGWGLGCVGGTLAAGCLGLILVGLIFGLFYGGPVCLLWGDECPRGRFWAGVGLMGTMLFLMVLGLAFVMIAGVAMLQRIHP